MKTKKLIMLCQKKFSQELTHTKLYLKGRFPFLPVLEVIELDVFMMTHGPCMSMNAKEGLENNGNQMPISRNLNARTLVQLVTRLSTRSGSLP